MKSWGAVVAAIVVACHPADRSSILADYFEICTPARVSDRLAGSLNSGSDQNVFGLFAATEMGRASGRRVSDLLAKPTDPSRNNDSGRSRTVVMTGEFAGAAAPVIQYFPQVLDTPYWPSIFFEVSAVGAGRLYAALNLLYPIHILDQQGVRMGTVGAPPPSWQQARRPSIGEFPGDRRREWDEYLASFSMIAGLAVVADSVLLVNHGVIKASEGPNRRILHTSFDVYAKSTRILADVPSPGVIVAYSRTSVFFARSAGLNWDLMEYRWRDKGSRSMDCAAY